MATIQRLRMTTVTEELDLSGLFERAAKSDNWTEAEVATAAKMADVSVLRHPYKQECEVSFTMDGTPHEVCCAYVLQGDGELDDVQVWERGDFPADLLDLLNPALYALAVEAW